MANRLQQAWSIAFELEKIHVPLLRIPYEQHYQTMVVPSYWNYKNDILYVYYKLPLYITPMRFNIYAFRCDILHFQHEIITWLLNIKTGVYHLNLAVFKKKYEFEKRKRYRLLWYNDPTSRFFLYAPNPSVFGAIYNKHQHRRCY